MENLPRIAILLPCYNEDLTITHSVNTIASYLSNLIQKGTISKNSFIAIVDDGSTDESWSVINTLNQEFSQIEIKGIRFSRNFGHQNAVFAGLIYWQSVADAIISLDIDLQDDITVINEMVEKYKAGTEIVYGIRKERGTDTFFKKNSALLYYRLLKIMKVDIHYNHADYRLTSQRVNQALKEFEETDLFLRGIFPFLGFPHDFVYYERKERKFGESKYPLRKMLKLAWIGVLSFSSYPLDLIFKIAMLSLIVSIFLGAFIFLSYLSGNVISGWTSLSIIISFFGSFQLLAIGLLSKYVSKIYDQQKKRPRFIIQEVLSDD